MTASLGGGVVSVDQGLHSALLSLAGYSAAQLPSTINRQEAMKVPALAAGVSILTGIGAQLPLVATPSEEPAAFLEELDPDVPRGWTIARTIDDLIFYPCAWWYVTSRSARGFPRTVQRVAPDRVQVDVAAQEVRIDGILVRNQDVIRFPGLTEGILAYGAEAIATALANIRQTRRYAENPAPSVFFTDPEGVEPMEPDEALNYMQAFRDAVTTRGYAYMAGLKANQMGWNSSDIQLIPARQQDAIEMARLLTIPGHYIEALSGGSSLTYTTLPEVRRDLIEVGGLAQFLVPIEQRLSMPDVTPRGTTVRFDAASVFLRVTPDAPTPEPAPEVPTV